MNLGTIGTVGSQTGNQFAMGACQFVEGDEWQARERIGTAVVNDVLVLRGKE